MGGESPLPESTPTGAVFLKLRIACGRGTFTMHFGRRASKSGSTRVSLRGSYILADGAMPHAGEVTAGIEISVGSFEGD